MTNPVTAITTYFQGALAEMRKVVWPTQKQTINYSVVVIGLSLGMAAFFGILDYVLNYGLQFLIK